MQEIKNIDQQIQDLLDRKNELLEKVNVKVINISCDSYKTNNINFDNYYNKGNFPQSDIMYIHNVTGDWEQTDVYSNSLKDALKYLNECSVVEIGNLIIGENELNIFDEDLLEEFDEAFLYIINNYEKLNDNMYILIETLTLENIKLVHQLLTGLNEI